MYCVYPIYCVDTDQMPHVANGNTESSDNYYKNRLQLCLNSGLSHCQPYV